MLRIQRFKLPNVRWLLHWKFSYFVSHIGLLIGRECEKIQCILLLFRFSNSKFFKALSLSSSHKVFAKMSFFVMVYFLGPLLKKSQCDCACCMILIESEVLKTSSFTTMNCLQKLFHCFLWRLNRVGSKLTYKQSIDFSLLISIQKMIFHILHFLLILKLNFSRSIPRTVILKLWSPNWMGTWKLLNTNSLISSCQKK